MGSGKSTLGRAVSRLSGITFIDLDLYIEGRYHSSVSDIFREKGEDGFRRLEQAMLHEVADFENIMVACGGGTPCFFDNMDYMNSRGITVMLEAPLPVLHRRLSEGRAIRPLIAGKSDEELMEFITAALAARMPHYIKAMHRFQSEQLETRQQIHDTASRFINQFLTRLLHD